MIGSGLNPLFCFVGSKMLKVLFYDKRSHRRQRVESLGTLQVLVETFQEHYGSFVIYISHRATNTERAPVVKEILMVLREADFCPLSETPSFTLVFNDTPKMRKTITMS